MIDGLLIEPLTTYTDERGSLTEVYRADELSIMPQMAYASLTHPGITRGPHEHTHQTDVFAFLSGSLEFTAWKGDEKATILVGAANPVRIIVSPGVVHAYRNVGDTVALVLNCPDRLYAGPGRSEPVDEIRHEANPDSPYKAAG